MPKRSDAERDEAYVMSHCHVCAVPTKRRVEGRPYIVCHEKCLGHLARGEYR